MLDYRKYFLLFIVIFGLSACQHTIFDPQPMGRGYSSYKEPYKSARGADAGSVGYEFSVENNQKIVEGLRFAAQDLVAKIDEQISYSMDEIYLDMPRNGVFYSSFDYVLRDEFLKSGYKIADSEKNALPLTLVAYEAEEISKNYVGGSERKIYLGLALDVVKGKAGSIVGDVYDISVYDFKPTKKFKTETGCNKCKKDTKDTKDTKDMKDMKCHKSDKCKKSGKCKNLEAQLSSQKCKCSSCEKCADKAEACKCKECKSCQKCMKNAEGACHKAVEGKAEDSHSSSHPVQLK